MKFISLYSSSKANAAYIGGERGGVLIDIGCSYMALCKSLADHGVPLSGVHALLLTHEHSDHIKGLFQFTKNTDIPVYASHGTYQYIYGKAGAAYSRKHLHKISDLHSLADTAGYEVTAFRTPHDSAESIGFTVSDGKARAGYCTDLGYVTDTVTDALRGCDFAFVEMNHDRGLLMGNPDYPYYLKQRISGEGGHLCNEDGAELIAVLAGRGVCRFCAGHLSLANNTHDLCLTAARERLSACGITVGRDCTFDIAAERNAGQEIVF